MQIDELSDMRCHIKEERTGADNHGQCNPIRSSPDEDSTHFKAACFSGSAWFGTDTQIRVRTVRVFPLLLLLVVPDSTPSRKSQRNALVASGASPFMTRATAASIHSDDIVRSKPILALSGILFRPCDCHERDDDFFDANPAVCHGPLFLTNEGAKGRSDQSNVIIGQSDRQPFQRAGISLRADSDQVVS